MGLLMGCSETDVFNVDSIVAQKNANMKNANMKVYPSTAVNVIVKAEEDWNSINDALHNAGPGEVV